MIFLVGTGQYEWYDAVLGVCLVVPVPGHTTVTSSVCAPTVHSQRRRRHLMIGSGLDKRRASYLFVSSRKKNEASTARTTLTSKGGKWGECDDLVSRTTYTTINWHWISLELCIMSMLYYLVLVMLVVCDIIIVVV